MRRIALLSLLSISAWSKPPVCRDLCFCNFQKANRGVAEARISAIDGAKTSFTIDTVSGTAPGSSQFDLPRKAEDVVDARWLVFFDDTAMIHRLPIDADGRVHCGTGAFTVGEARAAFASNNCVNELIARNSELTMTCEVTPECSSAPTLLTAGLALLLFRRRRREVVETRRSCRGE